MPDNILEFTGLTKLDIDPDKVLKSAQGEFTECMVIWYGHEENIQIYASTASGPRMLWWMERAKQEILAPDDD